MHNEDGIAPQSVTKFLEVMRTEPRTLGWDALFFFKRVKANILIMQQYIDRFITGAHFPPFENSEEPVGGGKIHVLMGLAMDKPRLSFENADIENSMARLTLRMVAGHLAELDEGYKGGKLIRTVTMMGLVNPVAGPTLTMNVALKAADTIVGDGGKIILDLKDGYDLHFSGTGDSEAGIKLGRHLQELMKAWPDHLTRFELSRLVQFGLSPLQPIDFSIRTRTAPGGKIAGSSTFGDGEVVLFITLKDGTNGQYPDSQIKLVNMLPEAANPYDCNLVLAHAFVMRKVILAWTRFIPWLLAAKLEPSSPTGYKGVELKATAGAYLFPRFRDGAQDGIFALTLWAPAMRFWYTDGPTPLRLKILGDKLTLDWVSLTETRVCQWQKFAATNPPWWEHGEMEYQLTAKLHAEYAFSVAETPAGPVLKLTRIDSYAKADVTFSSQNGPSDKNMPYEFTEMLKTRAAKDAAALAAQLDGLENRLAEAGVAIDAFRLSNLLFQGANVIAPREVYWPFDLTALGNLDPVRTQLVVTPSELTLNAGAIHYFTCTPGSSVTWDVYNLYGESGEKGTIDKTSGKYTAPSAASLGANGHRRVIVTATSGQMVSKSLVSLVAHDISVYPMVVKVKLGQQRALSAGTPGNQTLTWSVPSGMGRTEPDTDPDNKHGCTYFAPTTMPPRQSTDPLAYDSTRLVPVTVKPQTGGNAATVDVLITESLSEAYWLEATPRAAGAVKLTFHTVGRDGNIIEVPADDTEWTLLKKDDGELKDGLFTPKAGSSAQYTIAVAVRKSADDPSRCAYMIIPLPFVSSQPFVDMADT